MGKVGEDVLLVLQAQVLAQVVCVGLVTIDEERDGGHVCDQVVHVPLVELVVVRELPPHTLDQSLWPLCQFLSQLISRRHLLATSSLLECKIELDQKHEVLQSLESLHIVARGNGSDAVGDESRRQLDILARSNGILPFLDCESLHVGGRHKSSNGVDVLGLCGVEVGLGNGLRGQYLFLLGLFGGHGVRSLLDTVHDGRLDIIELTSHTVSVGVGCDGVFNLGSKCLLGLLCTESLTQILALLGECAHGVLRSDFLCFGAKVGTESDGVGGEDLEGGGLRIVDGDVVGQV